MRTLKEVFEKNGTLIHLKKGRMLFGLDDPPTKMFLIKTGAAKIYRYSDEGKEVMIDIPGPDQLITITPFLRHTDHVAYAETLMDSNIYWLPLQKFEEAISANPQLLREIAGILANKWDEFCDRVEAFVTRNSLGRLAYMILELSKRYGVQEDGVIKLPFPLTHQDLANLTGMFRETVSLSMQQLKKSGIIDSEKQIIVVKDKAQLETVATSSSQAAS
jgi:CRP/FNR family transcriptional regulator